MGLLTELIKESLEGKLTDKIRASENSNESDSGESKP